MNAFGLILAGLLALNAGTDAGSKVMGSGSEKIEVLPAAMRVMVKVEAEAETLEEAITGIQEQIKQWEGTLRSLNPVEGTLTVKGPHRAGGGTSYEARMMRTMRGRFESEAEPQEEKKVTLEADLKAEWKLNATELVSLLRESEKIRQAVRKAMPEKGKAKEPLTEEEEERMLMEMADDEEGVKPGEPVFLYVGRLDKGMLTTARREAFLKARQKAEETAGAAGGKLGSLASVNSNVNSISGDEEMNYYFYRSMRGMMPFAAEGADETEAVSPSLKALVFHVSVSASFELEREE